MDELKDKILYHIDSNKEEIYINHSAAKQIIEDIEAQCNNYKSLPSPCTVEQYEKITGEKFPDDALVWYLVIKDVEIPYWDTAVYSELDCLDNLLIIQTGQGEETLKDWRPE